MARKKGVSNNGADFSTPAKEIIDIPLQDEISNSFLEYSYTVIGSRALPDARDGLKPVHRRILFGMNEMGLRPDKPFVKVARISGQCFPAGALVATPDGLRPIEALQVDDKVLSPSGNPISVAECYGNPAGEMVRVQASGISIDATPGQLFRVVNDDYTVSWVKATDLVGKRLLRFGRSGDGSPVVETQNATAYVFGLLGAEGSCEVHSDNPKSGKRVSISMTDEEPVLAVQDWAREAGFEFSLSRIPSPREGWKEKLAIRFATRHTPELLEAVNARQWERTIPESILADRTTWASFLAGYIDGDGYLSAARGGKVHIASTSRTALVQIQAMLSSMGVVATLLEQPKAHINEAHRTLYTLEAYSDSARILAGLILPELKVARKRAIAGQIASMGRLHFPSSEKLPGRSIFGEFSRLHLGAGWYADRNGKKFRQSVDHEGRKFRHGRAQGRGGAHYLDRSYSVEQMHEYGWVDKLERIGSPLAARLQALRGFSFAEVRSVEYLEQQPNFDIQVDSEDHAFVVEGAVVHNCMGLYHPHGDSAINDALVRMAQDFSMSTPLIDGHGNFGSLDAGAAAARYIEARPAHSAMYLVSGVDEDTVDMKPNYDGSLEEPTVLPAAYPNLLVNGAEGIAVGMATKMAPHNLTEAVAAARLLLKKPKATLDEILTVMPGPDFPGGCQILGTEGAREAYETGKGTVRMRAVTRIEPVEGSRGRQQIIISALPYTVGPERVIESIKKSISDKKINFISDVIDLSEGNEMALHIELKSGTNPERALNTLCALTPMETTFAIANLALVDGQPKVMTLHDMLNVFLGFRKEVVLRRSEFRRGKARARLHLVDGLLIALDAIDLVVKTIRASKNTAEARDALMKKFKLSELQATHVLEMPLRRLTSLEMSTLEEEKRTLEAAITDLTEIIEVPKRLFKVVDSELAATTSVGTPRQSVIGDGVAAVAELTPGEGKESGSRVVAPVQVEPSTWFLTERGVLTTSPKPSDVVVGSATVTTQMLLLCADGVAVRVPAECPDGVKASTIANHSSDVVGIATPDVMLAAGTGSGVVKVGKPDWPLRGDEFSFMKVADGDRIVWAGAVGEGDDFVFVTSDAQLLRFAASGVRPQGRTGAGMAGVKMRDGARVIACRAVPAADFVVVTVSSSGRAKHTAVSEFPAKGRGGSGVRCHGLLKGDVGLSEASVRPVSAKGLPPAGKRDGSGSQS